MKDDNDNVVPFKRQAARTLSQGERLLVYETLLRAAHQMARHPEIFRPDQWVEWMEVTQMVVEIKVPQ